MKRIPIGGKYLAHERPEPETPIAPPPEPASTAATCPLYQAAAAHDGQPPDAWLMMFYRMYGDLP